MSSEESECKPLGAGPGPVREVLLVDRQTDEFLTSLDDLAAAECGGPEAAWDRAYLLAKLVAGRMGGAVAGDGAIQGKSVQVDPIKHTLKAPGIKCLKLKCNRLLSILL